MFVRMGEINDMSDLIIDRVWSDVKRQGPHRWCWVVWSGSRIVKSGICPTRLTAAVAGKSLCVKVKANNFRRLAL